MFGMHTSVLDEPDLSGMRPPTGYQFTSGIKKSGPCIEPFQVRSPSHRHSSDQFGGLGYLGTHTLVGVVGFEPTLDGF